MREILFRGFTPAENEKDKAFVNGEWIKGQWVQGSYWELNKTTYCFKEDYERDPCNTEHYIVFDQMTDWGLPNRHLKADVLPETVGQYTGLTDKNGKKVFEGDIHECIVGGKSYFFVVKHGKYYDFETADKRYGWYFQNTKTNDCNSFYGDEKKYVNIIGNIHDNPELLKGGAEE